jgi:hypothetical protein
MNYLALILPVTAGYIAHYYLMKHDYNELKKEYSLLHKEYLNEKRKNV